MLGKITLIAGLFAIGTALGSAGASAAPALPHSTPADGDGSLVLVKHGHHHHHGHRHHGFRRFGGGVVIYGGGYGYGYGYCRSWRHECAARWGWGTGGFYRCLARHGC